MQFKYEDVIQQLTNMSIDRPRRPMPSIRYALQVDNTVRSYGLQIDITKNHLPTLPTEAWRNILEFAGFDPEMIDFMDEGTTDVHEDKFMAGFHYSEKDGVYFDVGSAMWMGARDKPIREMHTKDVNMNYLDKRTNTARAKAKAEAEARAAAAARAHVPDAQQGA